MSYTGRELPDVVKDNFLIETEDSYLTKNYIVNKNLSSKSNASITSSVVLNELRSSGLNLPSLNATVHVSPYMSMLHYYANNFQFNKRQTYKSTFESGKEFELGFLNGTFIEITKTGFEIYSTDTTARPYQYMDVFYETLEDLYIKVDRLTEESDHNELSRTSATDFALGVESQCHSNFYKLNKTTRVLSGISTPPGTYPNILSKIYEDENVILFVRQVANVAPTKDAAVSAVTYGLFDFRILKFDKNTLTTSMSESSVSYNLDFVSCISNPVIVDDKIVITMRIPQGIRKFEIDFLGEFSFTDESLNINEHNISKYDLPKEYYLTNLSQTGLPQTQTIQRIKIPASSYMTFGYKYDDTEYLILTSVAINRKGSDYCKATTANSSTNIFIYNAEDLNDPVKSYVLPEGVYNLVRISDTEFLYYIEDNLYKLKLTGLELRTSQVTSNEIYDLGAVRDGELLLTSGPVLKRVSLQSEEVKVKNSSEFSTELRSDEYRLVSLEVSDFDGNLIEDETFYVELFNSKNDQNETIFEVISTDGKLEFYVSLDTLGQIGVKVSRENYSLVTEDSNLMEFSPLISDRLRNWEVINVTASKELKIADSISPNFILLIGAGGARGTNVTLRYSGSGQSVSYTGGAGGSGGVTLHRDNLSNCSVVIDSYSVKLLKDQLSEAPELTPEFKNLVWQFDQNGYQLQEYFSSLTIQNGIIQVNKNSLTNVFRLNALPITSDLDFCIEFCINLTELGSDGSTLISRDNNVLDNAFRIGLNSNGNLWINFRTGTTVVDVYSAEYLLVLNTDYHVVIERYNGILTIYVNGQAVSSNPSQSIALSTDNYVICNHSTTRASTFKIWNLRASRQAVYKEEFTPTWTNYQYNISTSLVCEARNGLPGDRSYSVNDPGSPSGFGALPGSGQFTLGGLRVQRGHREGRAQGAYYPITSRPHLWAFSKELGNYGSTATGGLARIYVDRSTVNDEVPPYTPDFDNLVWQFDQNGYQLDSYINTLSRYYGVLQVTKSDLNNSLNLGSFSISSSTDFCIEFCINISELGSAGADIFTSVDKNLSDIWRLGVNSDLRLWMNFRSGTTVTDTLNAADLLEFNKDYHITYERYNGILSVYINGVLSNSKESVAQTTSLNNYGVAAHSLNNLGVYKIWNLRASREAIYKGEIEPTWWNYQFDFKSNIQWHSKTDYIALDGSCIGTGKTLTNKPVSNMNGITVSEGLKSDRGLRIATAGIGFTFTGLLANSHLTQSYTIDFWVRQATSGTTPIWFIVTSPYEVNNRLLVGNESNQFTIWNNQASPRVKVGSLPSVTTVFSHVAITYSAGVWRYWHNGVNTITTNYTPTINAGLIWGLSKRDAGSAANVTRYRYRPGLKFTSSFTPMDSYSDSGYYINNPKPGVDGIYLITAPDGSQFRAYCDMTSDGGFWILTHHWIGSVPSITYNQAITKNQSLVTYTSSSEYPVIPSGYLHNSDYGLLKHSNATWISAYGSWQKFESLKLSDTYTGVFPIRTRVGTSTLYDRSLAWNNTPSIDSQLSFWTTSDASGWCGGAGRVGPTKVCPVLGPAIASHATNSDTMQLYIKASNNIGAGCISQKSTISGGGATVVGFYVNESLGTIQNSGDGTTLEYNLNSTQWIRIRSLTFHPRYDLGQFYILLHYTTHTGQIARPRIDPAFKILINGDLYTLSEITAGNGSTRRHGQISQAKYLEYTDVGTDVYFELVEA